MRQKWGVKGVGVWLESVATRTRAWAGEGGCRLKREVEEEDEEIGTAGANQVHVAVL